MTSDELRETQDRGRFFYERFPGAAAAEEAKRIQDASEGEQRRASRSAVMSSDDGRTSEKGPAP